MKATALVLCCAAILAVGSSGKVESSKQDKRWVFGEAEYGHGLGLSSSGILSGGSAGISGLSAGSLGLIQASGLGSAIGLGSIAQNVVKTIAVSQPVPVEVSRHVAVPVPQPYPVSIPQPFAVRVPQPVPIQVLRLYPVDVPRAVAVPVPVPQPYAVRVLQPVPVPVAVPQQSYYATGALASGNNGGVASSYGAGAFSSGSASAGLQSVSGISGGLTSSYDLASAGNGATSSTGSQQLPSGTNAGLGSHYGFSGTASEGSVGGLKSGIEASGLVSSGISSEVVQAYDLGKNYVGASGYSAEAELSSLAAGSSSGLQVKNTYASNRLQGGKVGYGSPTSYTSGSSNYGSGSSYTSASSNSGSGSSYTSASSNSGSGSSYTSGSSNYGSGSSYSSGYKS